MVPWLRTGSIPLLMMWLSAASASPNRTAATIQRTTGTAYQPMRGRTRGSSETIVMGSV